jgi:hypothetical protein
MAPERAIAYFAHRDRLVRGIVIGAKRRLGWFQVDSVVLVFSFRRDGRKRCAKTRRGQAARGVG